MRKLLALLLALMLPVCALAETYQFSFEMVTGGEAYLQLMEEALQLDPASADPAQEAALIQQLVNGLGFDILWQDDAMAIEMRMAGEKLLDWNAYYQGENILQTSTMLPGYALVDDSTSEMQGVLDAVDWAGVVLSVLPGLNAWANAVTPVETSGVFQGDAYEGGVRCITWQLGDKDMAALVDALLTEDVRFVLTQVLSAAGLNATAIISEMDATNARVAEEDRYAWVLRAVQDEADQVVGLSLTVLDDGAQVATLSVGMLDDGMRMVLGLGLAQQNYWCDMTIHNDSREDGWRLVGKTREWVAGKEDAFAYVSGAAEPELTLDWVINVAETGTGYNWDASINQDDVASIRAEGIYDSEPLALSGKVQYFLKDELLLTLKLSLQSTEAIASLGDDLTLVSMTDPADALLYEKLSKQFSAVLLARLMKLLPMELILQMNQFTLP